MWINPLPRQAINCGQPKTRSVPVIVQIATGSNPAEANTPKSHRNASPPPARFATRFQQAWQQAAISTNPMADAGTLFPRFPDWLTTWES